MKCIYTITNRITSKVYVGRTKSFNSRVKNHLFLLRHNKHRNRYLQFTYNTYGESNLIFEVLEECPEEFQVSLENYWCNLLNSHNSNFGYNSLPTGNNFGGAINSSIEIRTKANQARSRAMKGRVGPKHFLGRKHTLETIEKMSSCKLGAKNPMYGRIAPLEFRNILSERMKGSKHHNAKAVYCKETGITWGCIKDAAISLNIPHSTLRAMLNGCRINKTNIIYEKDLYYIINTATILL